MSTPSLSPAAEAVLTVLAQAERTGPDSRVTAAHVAHASGLEEKAFWQVAREMESAGLLTSYNEPLGKTIVLTSMGNEATAKIPVILPEGRIPQFAEGLDEAALAILDLVGQDVFAVNGSWCKVSTLRPGLREKFNTLDIDAATEAISRLTKKYLEQAGGNEPSYQFRLLGLLASSWGANALRIMDCAMSLFREKKGERLSQYSWSEIRRRANLPPKAMNLAYHTIKLAKLGDGFFTHSGERWLSVPPEPDRVLESKDALGHVIKVLPTDPLQTSTSTPQASASDSQVMVFNVEQSSVKPQEPPTPQSSVKPQEPPTPQPAVGVRQRHVTFNVVGHLLAAGGITWQIPGSERSDQDAQTLSINFPFMGRPPTSRDARRIVAEELAKAEGTWFRARGTTWLLDLGKLRERFKLPLDWMQGDVVVEPEYDVLPDTFHKEDMHGTLCIVVDRDTLARPETDTTPTVSDLASFLPVELKERFENLHCLGEGSFAAVYQVADKESLQRFALKVLNKTPDGLARARREVDAAKLIHPNILEVLEHHPDGHWFLMPLAEGTLGQLQFWGRLSPTSAREIALAVGNALVLAHAAEFLHRDLHPDNIVRHDGVWKVADWGLTVARGQRRLTRTKSIGGIETWTAPEQLKSLKDANERSDLFSLGRIVQWLATAQLPDVSAAANVSADHPLAAFVNAATKLNRDERPRSVREALALIDHDAVVPPAPVRQSERQNSTSDAPATPIAEPRSLLERLETIPAGAIARLVYRRLDSSDHVHDKFKIEVLAVDRAANVLRFKSLTGKAGPTDFLPLTDVEEAWREDDVWVLRISGYMDFNALEPYRYKSRTRSAVRPRTSGANGMSPQAEAAMAKLAGEYVKHKFPNHRVWTFSFGRDETVANELRALGFIETMGLRGPNGFDWILTDAGQQWVMEHQP